MAIIIAVLAEVAFISLFLITIGRRRKFISHYPELKRFYDYAMLSFLVGVLGKSVFLLLDLRSNGLLLLTSEQVNLVNAVGNLLALLAAVIFIAGWWSLLTVLTERYELVPVIEFTGKEEGEPLKPGLYLCNLPNCYPVIAKLLRGRAGLIVSRHPPEVVRERLNIEKTPILWLSTVRDKNAVSPTRLEFLLQTMVDFIRKTDDPKIIFLDGVEYLILENGFAPVFKFLTTLKDYTTIYNTVVIVPLNEEALDERIVNLMHREFEMLRLQP
ncbi:DUF835 domain-containing protein [Thermococcus barossii]|uniref:DUF835 domain-containing protein n=1 Tax=Thermococcus barossii TaxID=54077 RepID=A0A2Z2MHT8_9EURY|nr:DUF835 domain-containing protein [Thermococcus barossii]ASJ05273.1 hypothetical protein A3L01_07815 [Thermococcus barossii]